VDEAASRSCHEPPPPVSDEPAHLGAVPAQHGSPRGATTRDEHGPGDARALLAAVVESSEDAIITKTLMGVITSWNRAAQRLFGYAADETVGNSIRMLIPPERHGEEDVILGKLRAGQRIEHFETERVTKDGRRIEVALTISPVRDRNGQLIGASKILRDVTDRKTVERTMRELVEERDRLLESERAAREQAERASASKDEFLAVLSHELRTPLNAILGWTQVLKRAPNATEDITKGLDVIERNTRLQTRLVDDLLDVSRIITGQMRLDVQVVMPFTFVEAAVEALRPVASSRHITLKAVLDPSAGPVSGDASRLQQMVWNLVTNAIKFTPGGGRIEVLLERVNSHIEISVADTGIGIAADFLPHVFERFRRADSSMSRKHGGLGLGLAIVKHIVDLHGGQVHAKSAGEGRGTTFRAMLPLAVVHHAMDGNRQHPRVSHLPGSLAPVDLTGLDVLVVDDEVDSRDLVARVLRDSGATVHTVPSAGAALAAMGERTFAVVVTDIGMPEMDGYELVRRIRAADAARGDRIPAIALTAFARSEDRTRALLSGFSAHVAKPVEAAELVATVAAVAGRNR